MEFTRHDKLLSLAIPEISPRENGSTNLGVVWYTKLADADRALELVVLVVAQRSQPLFGGMNYERNSL
jgi:hypothetical protein